MQRKRKRNNNGSEKGNQKTSKVNAVVAQGDASGKDNIFDEKVLTSLGIKANLY